MTLVICEFLLPLLFALLAFGSGLLLERLTGRALPPVLLVPLGLAVMTVVSQLSTQASFSAPATPWLLLAVALAGWAVGWRSLRRLRFDPWPFAVGAAVYLSAIAPVLLSGSATLSGYPLDTSEAFHLAGIDWMLHHGRDFSSLAPVSYYAMLVKGYFSVAYPTGAHTVIGGVTGLTGQDYAWTLQPSLAFFMAALGLSLYAIARSLVPSRAAAAAIAFVASQPALAYAYLLQGSLKEVLMLPMLALLLALIAPFREWQGAGVRRVLPMAVVGAAGVAADGPAYAAWFGPVIVVLFLLALFGRPRLSRRVVAMEVALLVAVGAVLSIPTIVHLRSYFQLSSGVLSAQSEGGNLLHPLHLRQLLGVWLSGDHRVDPTGLATQTNVLLGIAVFAVLLGAIFVIRRRAWSLILFGVVSVFAVVFLTSRGSPWADAKVYVIVSPLVVLLALLGAVGLARRGQLLEGLLLGAAVALGVLWSDAILYHDTTLAPRARFAEMKKIDQRFKGQGPMLVPDFEDFSSYFLRDVDSDGPGDSYKVRTAILANGQPAGYGQTYDLDELQPPYVQQFRTILVRRSPEASRPPANYRRVYVGRYFEVWDRVPGAQVVAHMGLGTADQPASVPLCPSVQQLSAQASASGAQLATVERQPLAPVDATKLKRSPNFTLPGNGTVQMSGRGTLSGSVDLPAGGSYGVWLEGTVGRRLSVRIDGRQVASVAYQSNEPRQFAYAGTARLPAGSHRLEIVRSGGGLHPGNGTDNALASVVFAPLRSLDRQLTILPPARWRDLCGRRLDWIEVVRGLR